jgi:hypothetical protein
MSKFEFCSHSRQYKFSPGSGFFLHYSTNRPTFVFLEPKMSKLKLCSQQRRFSLGAPVSSALQYKSPNIVNKTQMSKLTLDSQFNILKLNFKFHWSSHPSFRYLESSGQKKYHDTKSRTAYMHNPVAFILTICFFNS